MALDGAMLGIIKKDLNDTALGARIEKITMPYKDLICLFLNKPNFKKTLLISTNPNSARIHFTNEKFENPKVPPMLCMLLRKRLAGGRLKSVSQYGIDRVLILQFDCKNELGDDAVISVVVEMFGRLSNVIFTENGKIIDALKRVDPSENKRFILPNAVYEFPQKQDRLNLFETDTESVIERIKTQTGKTALQAISSVIDGLSPVIYREFCFKSVGDFEKPVEDINAYQFSKLFSCLEEFKNNYPDNVTPCLLRNENGVIKEFTFIEITQYGEKYSAQYFDSVHKLLQNYFSKRDNEERIKQISVSITKTVNTLISRTKRKIALREKELSATKEKEKFRVYGELIKANLHLIKSGDSYLECKNYYDTEYKTIKIPLDISLSPIKNAHKYFKDYRKLSTAAGIKEELIAKAKADLVYFESVLDCIKRTASPSDIEAIKQELVDEGFIRLKKKSLKQKPQKQNPEKYISTDGFEIFVGKNNYQNDWLTTKFAEKQDFWFHTKNIPGSHTIVVTKGRHVPDSTLTQAAVLAATHSKAQNSRLVAVDYTRIKYVKKPSGAKPGMVIYKTNKTAYVDPDFELCEKLKEK